MASDGHPPRSEKLIRCPRSLSGDLELMPAPDRPIYLDYNGTTPVAPEVLDAMLPFLRDQFGNASSTTPLGRTARAAIEEGRAEVAALIGAKPEEIIFTGGGTEASNHAIRGFAAVAPAGRRRIVTSMVEHPATEMPCRRLEREGFSVSRIGVDADGIVDLAAARMAINGETALVTIIHAQNEIGTLEPVAELAEAAREARAPIHVDASQSLGKVPVDVAVWGIDALTLAGHKLYAPKGIGALYLRSGHAIPSVLDGAGQEGGRRPGTENVPYIVGLGRACRIARERLAEDAARVAALRERLWQALAAGVPGLKRLGGAHTLPNTRSVLFPGTVGNDLLEATPAIAASTGSACHAGSSKPSAVILALGISPDTALGAVRLSLGRSSDTAQVDAAAVALIESHRRFPDQ
jgi:cysteine desulfurase